MTEVIGRLKALDNCSVIENASLSNYTGFRTGGPTVVVEPLNTCAFVHAVRILSEEKAKFRVLGNGSNTVALDEGSDGIVVRTQKALVNLYIDADANEITAGAGVLLSQLCNFALKNSLTGLEFAYGIPGTVGGAVYMNAGAYDGEISFVLKSAKVLDIGTGEVSVMKAAELQLSYRHSIIHENRNLVVLEAVFSLAPGDATEIREKMDDLKGRRIAKQPLDYPSCGSTFKRPVGNYAGKLIEECGLKGYTVGGACVSEKHAGFVINKGGATTADIFGVIDHVQKTVLEETGYYLDCEVEVLK